MEKQELEVLYNLGEGAVAPDQGYDNDFAYDLYAAKGLLVPPLTFKSRIVQTNLKLAFDPTLAGMKISLRSGTAAKTPLIVSNSPGIVEGSYRNGIGILVRNTFIDDRLVEFAFTSGGERINVAEIPDHVMTEMRRFYQEETEMLDYEGISPEVKKLVYKTHVPAGTIYIPKHYRIAQMHFAPKVHAKLGQADILPDSVRGENGIGSSGDKKKENKNG